MNKDLSFLDHEFKCIDMKAVEVSHISESVCYNCYYNHTLDQFGRQVCVYLDEAKCMPEENGVCRVYFVPKK